MKNEESVLSALQLHPAAFGEEPEDLPADALAGDLAKGLGVGDELGPVDRKSVV